MAVGVHIDEDFAAACDAVLRVTADASGPRAQWCVGTLVPGPGAWTLRLGRTSAPADASAAASELTAQLSDAQAQVAVFAAAHACPGRVSPVRALLLTWCPRGVPAAARADFGGVRAGVRQALGRLHTHVDASAAEDAAPRELLRRVGVEAAQTDSVSAVPPEQKSDAAEAQEASVICVPRPKTRVRAGSAADAGPISAARPVQQTNAPTQLRESQCAPSAMQPVGRTASTGVISAPVSADRAASARQYMPQPPSAAASAGGRAVAVHAYTATDANEASIVPGDEIADAERSADAPDWLLGRVVRTGARGYVPASYVRMC